MRIVVRGLLLAGCLAVAGCGSTVTFASVTKTLTTSGKCSKAADWTPAGVPLGNSDVLVPAGKTLKVEGTSPCTMRSLDLEGTLTGQGPIHLGSSLRAEGPAGLDIALKVGSAAVWLDQGLTLTGSYLGSPQILDFGPSQISNVVVGGSAHYQLGEAARFESLWTMQEGSYFDTAGYNVGGMGDTQAGLPSTLKLHGSEWDTGEWRVAASVALEASEATIYQDDGSYGITECHGQTLGNLIVENFRPHLLDNCIITGNLALNRTADHSPIVFAGAFLPNERAAPTFTVGSLSSNGTEAQPVVGEGHVTFVVPHDLTVAGCVSFNELTVIGGTVTVDCGGVETAY